MINNANKANRLKELKEKTHLPLFFLLAKSIKIILYEFK